MRNLWWAGVIGAVAFPWMAHAQVYVAPNGVDGAAGTECAPVATLAHAIGRASNGQTVYLQRGGVYAAVGVDVGSGRTITAYGQGADPVLTASTPVTMDGTWTSNASVVTAAVAQPVLALYVNGRFVPLARYPNTGFLRIDNDDSVNQIVDADLAARPGVAAGRWTGAQVRWRRWSWWWETRPIANHSNATTLDLGDEGRFQDPFSDPGSGYFIDNDLDELDAPGEWFWGNGTLYLYPPSWADRATMRVDMVTSAETGVTTGGTHFDHVTFARYAGTALQIGRPATVDHCTFEQLETDAVRFTWDAQPFVVRNSVFRDVRNVAIAGWANRDGATGSRIERNLFLRIGMERGYGGSGSWHAAGVIVGAGKAVTVTLNRFVETGYAGVILGSDGHTVTRNIFVRTMGTLNDGAAVYTNCNASVITENIILDTLGDLETSHPWWPLGHGIWPEFLSNFRDTQILNNTVYGSNGNGVFLPNNFTCTVSGNHLLDNRTSGLDLSGNTGDDQNHTITGNVLAVVSPTRRILRPENLTVWWLPPYPAPNPSALHYEPGIDYGSMGNTTFIAPQSGADVIRVQDGANLTSVAEWATTAPWASATGSSVVRRHAMVLFNDTESPVQMPVPAGTWALADGTPAPSSLPLAPFRSVVLVTDAAPSGTPAYIAASGIDWRATEPTLEILPVGTGGSSSGSTSSSGGGASTGSGGAGSSSAGSGQGSTGGSASSSSGGVPSSATTSTSGGTGDGGGGGGSGPAGCACARTPGVPVGAWAAAMGVALRLARRRRG